MHRMGSFSSVVFKKKIFSIYCVKTMSCIDSDLGFRIGIKNPNVIGPSND
jgi:hypothetical protein